MKQWFSGLVVSAFILLSSATLAQGDQHNGTQQSQDKFARLPAMVQCSTAQVMKDFLSSYGELEFAVGKSFIIIPDGRMLPGDMSFYYNSEKTSYTIVVKLNGVDMWCITNMGTEFAPGNPARGSAL